MPLLLRCRSSCSCFWLCVSQAAERCALFSRLARAHVASGTARSSGQRSTSRGAPPSDEHGRKAKSSGRDRVVNSGCCLPSYRIVRCFSSLGRLNDCECTNTLAQKCSRPCWDRRRASVDRHGLCTGTDRRWTTSISRWPTTTTCASGGAAGPGQPGSEPARRTSSRATRCAGTCNGQRQQQLAALRRAGHAGRHLGARGGVLGAAHHRAAQPASSGATSSCTLSLASESTSRARRCCTRTCSAACVSEPLLWGRCSPCV